MAGDGRRAGARGKRSTGGSAVPPGEDPGSTAVRIRARGKERYARLEVTSRSRNDLLLDAAIAVAVFAASLALLAVGEAEDDAGGIDVLGVLLTALASLPLVARRAAPLQVFVLTALASTVLRLVAEPAGPPLGPTLALYWVAAAGEESRARTRLVLALAGGLLVAHVAASGLAEDAFPLVESVFGILVWGGAWLAGDRTRLRHERLAELEERALRAEREAERERRLAAAEERGRIARDLHDSAGHAMNVILVHAGMGRLQSERDPESAREVFATIEEVARETVGEIDQMVRVLREDASAPGEVEPPPGLAALDGLVERHRAAGLRVTTTIRGDRQPLPPGIDRGAYRILQEALTNAARHGDGSAAVELAFGPNVLEVTVANPIGRNGADRPASGGHGVIGMRERAALLGGSLDVGARNGSFQLRARLPFA
jgi:signal transduction histidine kinase